MSQKCGEDRLKNKTYLSRFFSDIATTPSSAIEPHRSTTLVQFKVAVNPQFQTCSIRDVFSRSSLSG